MTVDHTTVLGAGTVALDSVTYDGNTNNTAATALSDFLYTQKVIEFSAFSTNNVVSFSFSGLPPKHEKVIVRARVHTECSTFSSQNQTIKMTLVGTSTIEFNEILNTGLDRIIEGSADHTGTTFTVTFTFGTFGNACRRIIQDISLYA